MHNLETMISAARDLNEHGGMHRQLPTSSQPMSELFRDSVNVWNHPVSLTRKNERLLQPPACIFSISWTCKDRDNDDDDDVGLHVLGCRVDTRTVMMMMMMMWSFMSSDVGLTQGP